MFFLNLLTALVLLSNKSATSRETENADKIERIDKAERQRSPSSLGSKGRGIVRLKDSEICTWD